MLSIKTHKSVQQIAKKHRMDVSDIKKQLDMGIPIEHEHTKDKVLATDIALQHLDEIPDYYTRLIKMERDAKKDHKKFKDVKEGTLHNWYDGSKSKNGKPGWVQADGSPCANEPGETKTPKCFSSARLRSLRSKGKTGESLIKSAVSRKREEDKSQQSKTGAASPTNVATFVKGKKDPNYIKAEPGIKEEMEINEAQKDKPGKGSGKKDACYDKVKSRYDVWPSAYASGALVKCRKVGAANWGTKSEAVNPAQQAAIAISMKKRGIKPKSEVNEDCWDGYEAKGMKKKGKKMVPNCVPVKEETGMVRYCPKCKKDETQSECKYGPEFWRAYSSPSMLTTNQMKYDIAQVHPANEDYEYSMARSEISTIIGAAKRLRKKIGKGEGNIVAWVQSKITKAADYLDTAADYVDSGEMKKESVSIEDSNGNHYAEFIDIIKSQPLKPSKGIGSRLVGEGALPSPIDPSAHKQAQRTQKLYNKGTGTDNSNEKEIFLKRTGPQLPLAKKEDKKELQTAHYNMKTFGDFMSEASAAWQRKEGKNPEGGLNKKGIASYRKENPGSKLSMAVTTPPSKLKPGSKSANRRKSFCARMGGMPGPMKDEKGRPTRKALSLRKWNC